MKIGKQIKAKGISMLLACSLGMCSLATGCQPTPATEAVAQKQDPVAMAAAEGSAGQSDADASQAAVVQPEAYEPCAYKTDGHWTDTVQKNSFFTVTADVDISVPEQSSYPVEMLAPQEISQEKAKELIQYFAGDVSFYKLPLQETKADIEEQILSLKETLAMDQANGDEDAVRADQEAIEELENARAQAPEEAEHIPADLTYDYPLDYDGQALTEYGQTVIDVAGTNADGVNVEVNVRKGGPEAGSAGAFFNFSLGALTTESVVTQSLDTVSEERAAAQEMEEPLRTEQLEYIDRNEQLDKQLKERFDLATFDVETAQTCAIAVLQELGITDMQITHCEKGLFALDTGNQHEDDWSVQEYADTPCTYIEFARQAGGVPIVVQSSSDVPVSDANMSSMYSAPFIPEIGSIVVDGDGKVLQFSWNQPAQIVQMVSDSSDPLPFDEVKDRVADQLYFMLAAPIGLATSDGGSGDVVYQIEEVRLAMAYINAKGNPDKVLVIPAWYVKAHGSGTYTDPAAADYPVYAYDTEVVISALDGSPVLMPGILENMSGGIGG